MYTVIQKSKKLNNRNNKNNYFQIFHFYIDYKLYNILYSKNVNTIQG